MDDFTRWELASFPRPHGRHAVTVTARAARRLAANGRTDFTAWDGELRAAGAPL